MRLPQISFRKKRSVRAFRRHAGRRFADLYEGNASYDASLYAANESPFVVLKATENFAHVDSRHASRCVTSHAVGLAVGHYHFFRGFETGRPELEAKHFWEIVAPHFLTVWPKGKGHDDMPHAHTDFLIVDVETGTPDHAELANFCRELKRISGQEVIGYSGKSFLLGHDLHVPGDKWWVADYPNFPGRLGGGRQLWAHQFTDHASMKGIGQPTDASVLVNKNAIRYWSRQ